MAVLTGASSKFLAQLRSLAAAPLSLSRAPVPLADPATRSVQRRLTAAQVAELVAEYQAGAAMRELAERWGVHRTTVAGHLRRAGIELRRHGLSDGGWSLKRLGERFDCDEETVRQALKRTGITLRTPWQREV